MKPVITEPAPGDRTEQLGRLTRWMLRRASELAARPPAIVQSTPPKRRKRRRAA